MKESKHTSTSQPDTDDNPLRSDMVALKDIVSRIAIIRNEINSLEFFRAQYDYPVEVQFAMPISMVRCMAAITDIDNGTDDFNRNVDKAIGEL